MGADEPGEKTFVRVTNQDIYKEVKAMHIKLDEIGTSLKWHRRWLTGLTTAIVVVIGWVFGKP